MGGERGAIVKVFCDLPGSPNVVAPRIAGVDHARWMASTMRLQILLFLLPAAALGCAEVLGFGDDGASTAGSGATSTGGTAGTGARSVGGSGGAMMTDECKPNATEACYD